MIEGDLKVNFDALPVWRGVLKNSSQKIETAPLEIAITKNGFIQQVNKKNINDIIDYSNDCYSFLTTPP